MEPELSVRHDRAAEDPVEKARWFARLSLAERMRLLCEVTELALSQRPELVRGRHAPAPAPGLRVVRLARG
jgi:hypothetical protein